MGVDSTKKTEVLKKVTIPIYFYSVILPQRASYYSDYTVNFELRPTAKCPLHDEDTPSMRYYEDTNSFYCFGCRVGGSIITLHREFIYLQTNVRPTFEQSVEYLYQQFILGSPIVAAAKQTRTMDDIGQLSTPVDMSRYSAYRKTLEGQLLVDTELSESAKRTIWDIMDSVDILVSKNVINAIEAMGYIKDRIKESLSQSSNNQMTPN